MIVFADHLENVTDDELDARLLAWDQLIPGWVVFKQRTNENLKSKQCAE
jgi:hypothetical protein